MDCHANGGGSCVLESSKKHVHTDRYRRSLPIESGYIPMFKWNILTPLYSGQLMHESATSLEVMVPGNSINEMGPWSLERSSRGKVSPSDIICYKINNK